MSEQEPFHPIDVTFLLHAVELLDGDPQVEDYSRAAKIDISGFTEIATEPLTSA